MPPTFEARIATLERLMEERKSCAFGLSLLILVATPVLAQQSPQQTFRDSSGRTIGTATTSGNQTTFRDSSGHTIGTATTNGNQTTFRDSSGHTTGTLASPRR
jgi:YD repeat-containing protein